MAFCDGWLGGFGRGCRCADGEAGCGEDCTALQYVIGSGWESGNAALRSRGVALPHACYDAPSVSDSACRKRSKERQYNSRSPYRKQRSLMVRDRNAPAKLSSAGKANSE